jgi:hypothetical protein
MVVLVSAPVLRPLGGIVPSHNRGDVQDLRVQALWVTRQGWGGLDVTRHHRSVQIRDRRRRSDGRLPCRAVCDGAFSGAAAGGKVYVREPKRVANDLGLHGVGEHEEGLLANHKAPNRKDNRTPAPRLV